MSKPPKDNQTCLRDEEPSKFSPGRDALEASTSPGCPRSIDKHRTPSMVIGSSDEQIEAWGSKRLGKKEVIM